MPFAAWRNSEFVLSVTKQRKTITHTTTTIKKISKHSRERLVTKNERKKRQRDKTEKKKIKRKDR